MPEKLKLPHPLLLIIGIGFLLYGCSLFFDYTNFDDTSLIQNNQSYISDISNLADAFRKTVFITGTDVFYRPMETVWFMLNAQFAGSDWKELPIIFHVSSLLLHCVAVYLIFLLLQRFNHSKETSLFLSLIFLIHPALAQAVAWVPGVVDILVTIFSISAFLFFLEFIKSQKRKHFVLHILFFALALYTKEIAVGLIIVISVWYRISYSHLNLKSLRKESFGQISPKGVLRTNLKSLLIAWLIVAAVWFMMRDSALQHQQQTEIGVMISSIAFNLPALIQYIGKILFPFNLSVMPLMKDTTFIFGIAALSIFFAIIFISKEKRKNWILFSVVWFVIFLLPTFIKTSEFRVHQFYEHRMYLPMVGFLLFAAEINPIKKITAEKISHRISAVVILLFFFTLAFTHSTTFSDTKSFLDNAVRTSPNSSLAHRNMGIYFQDMDEKTRHADKTFLENAANEYKKSLELNPHEKDLHANLGVIYDRWGKKDLAEKEYLIETKMNPANSHAFHNLGMLYSERNENEKAEIYFKKAIEARPVLTTYEQLALLYKKMGRQQDFEKIISILQQETNTTNQKAQTINNQQMDTIALGIQLMQNGKLREAEGVFKKELIRDSLNAKALFNLGLVYYSEKRLNDAEMVWRKAVRIDSTYIDAFNNLAICLAQQGKNNEAEAVLKKNVSSNPNYIDGYFNLANFYARNGNEKDALIYVSELKKRGIAKEQFQQRGIKMSEALEKVFDKQN